MLTAAELPPVLEREESLVSIDVIPGVGAHSAPGVVTVLLNRPEAKNCFAPEDYQRLGDVFLELDERDDVEIVVLRGAGDAFTTGGDLLVKQRAIGSGRAYELFEISARAATHAFNALEACGKVVIAAIDGHCQASGVSLALCADLSVATDRSLFRIPEALVGVADPFVATRLPGRVGMSLARWLIYTAEAFSAEQAASWGVVNEVVPAERLESRVLEIAELLLRTAPNSRREYKRAIAATLLSLDAEVMLRANLSEFALEGITAFAERRPPAWGEASIRERERLATAANGGSTPSCTPVATALDS